MPGLYGSCVSRRKMGSAHRAVVWFSIPQSGIIKLIAAKRRYHHPLNPLNLVNPLNPHARQGVSMNPLNPKKDAKRPFPSCGII